MILVLTIAIAILTIFLMSAIAHIGKIQKELKEISDEQSRQNEDAIFLLQSRIETAKVLVQHTEVLKFLLDESMQNGNIPYPFMGPMGEA
jgi:predicted secreted acid phosphatase